MNIAEAAKACKGYGWIARRSWYGHMRVCPTNEPECCIIQAKGQAPCPRWEPQAEDLVADDWEVATEEKKLPTLPSGRTFLKENWKTVLVAVGTTVLTRLLFRW